MMKVGDLVTMKSHRGKHGLIECSEVGIIQKIVPMTRVLPPMDPTIPPRNVYHVRWGDRDITNHYDKEIVVVSKVQRDEKWLRFIGFILNEASQCGIDRTD